MNKPSKLTRQTLFDLGFAHGTDVDEDPSELEFRSRVREYQLGYIVGRSFGEAVKQASRRAGAVVAGELGWRFGVSLPELMAAMSLSEEQQQIISLAYADASNPDLPRPGDRTPPG